MQAFNQRAKRALQKRRVLGLNRKIVNISKGNTTRLNVNGQYYLNFSSNDYLGLAHDAELIRQWQEGLSLYGSGSASSPMVVGNSYPHDMLRHCLGDWLGYDDAVLFNSGFSANQALLLTLLKKDDLLLQDKLNHASLIEAGMLSSAKMKRFKHNDVTHLASLISHDETPTVVVTEGVFSMDGDLAPLSEIKKTVSNKAMLIVDDAHGIGVLGQEGKGTSDETKVKPDILVVTFGKALGMSGAAIMCNSLIGEYLSQFARHHVYSTAMPPAQAYTLCHAISMVKKQQWRRDKLGDLDSIYRNNLSQFRSYYVDTKTAIKPVILGSEEDTLRVANAIKQQGIWVTGIRPPTVPSGQSRLRVTLTASHSESHVTELCSAITRSLEETIDAGN